MPKNQIRIVIEGLPENNGALRANDFIKAVNTLLGTANKIDRGLTGRGAKGNVSYELNIIELSYCSPAVFAVEQVAIDPELDIREKVNKRVHSIFNSVTEDKFKDESIDYDVIKNMLDVTNLIGKRFKSIQFSINGESISFDKEYKAKMDIALAKDITYPGFVRGDLQYINIHGKQRVFRIYPTIGPNIITCYFNDDLKEAAKAAIDCFVEVRGELHYKTMSKFPYQIVVKKLNILPTEEDLPDFADMLGVDPKITGDLLSEEYVRAVRDAK